MKSTDSENKERITETKKLSGIKTWNFSYPSPDFIYVYRSNIPSWFSDLIKEYLNKQDAVLEKVNE